MICGGHRGAAFILWPLTTAPQHLAHVNWDTRLSVHSLRQMLRTGNGESRIMA